MSEKDKLPTARKRRAADSKLRILAADLRMSSQPLGRARLSVIHSSPTRRSLDSLLPISAIQRAVIDRFRDVRFLHVGVARQIGNRPAHFQNSIIGAR